jgi:hypothetical protein
LGEKKMLGDSILKAVVMTTLRHTTKKQTHHFQSSWNLEAEFFPTPGLF